MALLDEARAAIARGWDLTLLEGKKPILENWPALAKRCKLENVERWISRGYNIGVICGKASGVTVLDVDIAKGGVVPPDLPPTPTCDTGGGGVHLFFADAGVGNSAGKIGPHIDVRGNGGQVVLAGSTHPDTKKLYQWRPGLSPEDVPLAPFPMHLFPAVPTRTSATPADAGRTKLPRGSHAASRRGWAAKALAAEVARVANAAEGTRNDSLNIAAFSLGQIVAGGALGQAEVEDALLAAAQSVGLDDKEARSTIRSGITAGALEPRTAPERRTATVPPPATPTRQAHQPVPAGVSERGLETTSILIPGTHVSGDGELIEVGNHQFASRVLDILPPDLLYRRESVVGVIDGDVFRAINATTMRRLIDQHLKLTKWAGKDEKHLVFVAASPDHGELVLNAAAERVRQVDVIAPYPMFGRDFELLRKGWNESERVYITCDVPEPCGWHGVFEELLVDFPWADLASLENFIGCLLTVAVRLAVDGPVPMHMIAAAVERCGKTKLAEEVAGAIFLGRATPAMQLGGDDSERDKRILSMLLRASGIMHLDNIGEFLDSPALSSLITSRYYSGRILGRSELVELRNLLTLIATANNPKATGEIVKRCVPILLNPKDDAPEMRTGFAHPDLMAYVLANRPRLLGALLGMVQAWLKAGRPPGTIPMGSFEGWARIVGGILQNAGFTAWRTNARSWGASADPFSDDLRALVTHWHETHGTSPVTPKQLYEIASQRTLFDKIMGKPSEQARITAFGMMLGKQVGRVVSQWRIVRWGEANHRTFRLEPLD